VVVGGKVVVGEVVAVVVVRRRRGGEILTRRRTTAGGERGHRTDCNQTQESARCPCLNFSLCSFASHLSIVADLVR
jgi:hypothetical protein